ncbi:hypothetical protein SAMN02745866_00831 [Alteromonadaceae bacterium Bs31]|nr:hypothetical protein SAMN02745866_00831 [Alteromonadaceae bacterium Bs31]
MRHINKKSPALASRAFFI